MTVEIIPKNVSQIQAKFSITDRVVIQPNTWYTCPTGKKAIVKGSVQCTSTGAAASADFVVAGTIMYRWLETLVREDYRIIPRSLRVQDSQMAFFEVELEAGEIIETTQSSGTNAEFNIFADVLELPG